MGMFQRTLLVIVAIFSISYAKQYLVVIDDIDVTDNTLYIVEQIRKHSIAILNEEEIASLQTKGYVDTIIDEDPIGKKYYLVYPLSTNRIDINAVASILMEFIDCFLVRVNPENEEQLFDLHAEFRHIDLEPMRFALSVSPELQGISDRIGFNPTIQNIVDRVNLDTVVANIMWLQNVGSRHVSYTYMSEKIVPWCIAKLKAYGCDSVYTQQVPNYNAPNIVGVKLGSKFPSYKKYYILGGHVDNMPKADPNKGADDNATGVSVVLEAARALKDIKLDYTVFFIIFNVEELGDIGSSVFAKDAKQKTDSIIGMICAEMCGHTPAGQPENIVVTDKKSMPASTALAQAWMKAAQNYAQQLTVLDPTEVANSDHASFWKQGYSAIKIRENIRCDKVYHTGNDYFGNPDGLNNPKQVARTAKTNVAVLCELAKLSDQTLIKAQKSTVTGSATINLYVAGKQIKIAMPSPMAEHEAFSIAMYKTNGQLVAPIGTYSYTKSMKPIFYERSLCSGINLGKGFYVIEISRLHATRHRILLPFVW